LAPRYLARLLEAAGQPGVIEIPRHAPPANALVEPLTAREREVLLLLLEGTDNRGIAHKLVLSVNTVKKHVMNIYGKLGVQSRTQAVAKVRTLPVL
jgi:ATP/maltotriose-dependent transcriptional regulator MalT